MKISIYDPLYSKLGHYQRFNNHLIKLFSGLNEVEKIKYYIGSIFKNNIGDNSKLELILVERIMDFQKEFTSAIKMWNKIKINYHAFISYAIIIGKLNKSNSDLVFFSSAGQEIFWINVLLFLRKPYSCFVINTKYTELNGFFGSLRKALFEKYISKSSFVLVTEKYYIDKLTYINKSTFQLNESILTANNRKPEYTYIKGNIITLLGNLSGIKIDIKLLVDFTGYLIENTTFKLVIAGSVSEDILSAIKLCNWPENRVNIQNRYLSSEEYQNYLQNSDIIFLPYKRAYAENATSGIMWDVFHQKKLFISPDYQPLSHYAKEYNVGVLIKPDCSNIEIVIKKLTSERITPKYDKLYAEYSINNTFDRLRIALERINGYK